MKQTIIKEQINWVNNWTAGLIKDLENSDFGMIDAVKTSINWQLGHIIISNYFHAVQSIVPADSSIIRDLENQLPIADFKKYYFAGSNPSEKWENRPDKMQLLTYQEILDESIQQILAELGEDDLSNPTEIQNPIAKTKYDALTFVFKHQMWHNGQIAMMKRLVG